MAGMFYTLQEVIEKLGKTEAEIKNFVREGRLREFRDGAKQLYKTEDVDAIVGAVGAAAKDKTKLDDTLEISIDETGEISLAPEELDALMSQDTSKNKAQGSNVQLDETGELLAEETLGGTPKKPSKEKGKSKAGDEIELMPADSTKGASKISSKPGSDSISLVDSQRGSSDTSNEDTKISLGGDSINVLSESDTDFKISSDTSSETKVMPQKPKSLDEKGGGPRLDDDEDVSGNSSGLLDLSLQADDTSLGAVLDDIYPDSAGAPAAEQTPGAGAAVTEEAEKILEQPEPAAAAEGAMPQEIFATAGAAIAFEPPPDSSSNIFGIILFVPLAVLIYTAIVVLSGYKPISELQMLSAIEPIIWYVAGGAAAIVILAVLIGTFAGKGGPKKPKAPKEPKVKKVKPPKEKKGKKGAEPPPAAK